MVLLALVSHGEKLLFRNVWIETYNCQASENSDCCSGIVAQYQMDKDSQNTKGHPLQGSGAMREEGTERM